MKQPELGKKISNLRKERGLTQEELIEKCNISIRTIQRIEAGEVTPRSYTLKAIFEALEYDFAKEEAARISFEKSCEITPNWFQEPKSWVIYSWIVLMPFALTPAEVFFENVFKVDYYCCLAILFAVQLILVGNAHAKDHKNKFDFNAPQLIIGFNNAKVLGHLLLYITLDFYLIYNVLRFQWHDETSIFMYMLFILIVVFLLSIMIRYAYPYANKVLGEKIGFKITEDGLLNNSMFTTHTLIPWEDIERVEVVNSMFGYQWIVPIHKHPENFINQQTNHFKKLLAKMNYREFGSPIRIYTTTLNITPSRLYKILCLRFKKFYD